MAGQKDRMPVKQAITKWIEEMMDKRGLNPSTVAKLMGCKPSIISKMQNRTETRIPTFIEICLFSKRSGIPLDEIASGIFKYLEASDEPWLNDMTQYADSKDDSYIKKFSSVPFEEQKLIIDMYDILMSYLDSKKRNK